MPVMKRLRALRPRILDRYIAREMLASVRHKVAGAYIMPPLERYELALEVVDGFLDRKDAP